MTVYIVSRRVWPLTLALFATACGSGCTSVLSTASLRDLVLGIDDRTADAGIPSGPSADASAADEDDAADAERRAAAIEEAINRLSKVDELDDDARTTLIATLQRTDQEDWPVVVDAFAESLGRTPSAHVVAKADLDAASGSSPQVDAAMEPVAIPSEPAVPETADGPAPETGAVAPSPTQAADVPPAPAPAPAPAPVSTTTVAVAPMPTPTPADDPVEPQGDETVEATAPEPALPPVKALVIRNASFASRVQAWGVLDRFAVDRFRPGQEVIVYFELEGLSAGESAAGHTTCIDSRLRLVTDDATLVHEWTFEPIAETCRAQRHDYFARYVVKIPVTVASGPHRVELTVTDTLTGKQAVESLALDILAPLPAAE